MSHTVDVKTEIKNLGALKAACNALKLEYKEGHHNVQLFSDTVGCDFSVKLPGWRYPIAVNSQTGEVKFDNYNGSWGQMDEFNKLNQEYGLQVVENEPDVMRYLTEGYQMQREKQPDGSVQLVLFRQ